MGCSTKDVPVTSTHPVSPTRHSLIPKWRDAATRSSSQLSAPFFLLAKIIISDTATRGKESPEFYRTDKRSEVQSGDRPKKSGHHRYKSKSKGSLKMKNHIGNWQCDEKTRESNLEVRLISSFLQMRNPGFPGCALRCLSWLVAERGTRHTFPSTQRQHLSPALLRLLQDKGW